MPKKLRAGILASTGTVGQRFIELLANHVFMDANRALSARDVFDRIQEKLPPMLERHKDPMASVTTALNRLVVYGEAQAVALENGRRAWKRIADSEPESVPS